MKLSKVKNIALVAGLFCAASVGVFGQPIDTTFQNSAVLVGTVRNQQTNFIHIEYVTDYFSNERELFRTLLQPNGSFIMTVPLETPTLVKLVHNKREMQLFLQKGVEYRLEIDGFNPSFSLKVTQQDGYEDNNCLQTYTRAFDFVGENNFTFIEPSLRVLNSDYEVFYSMPQNNCYRYMEIQRQEEKSKVANCDKTSPAFRAFIDDFIEYKWRSYQLHFIAPKVLSADLLAQYEGFLTDRSRHINRISALDNPTFSSFIDEYFLLIANQLTGRRLHYNNDWEIIYQTVQSAAFPPVHPQIKSFFLGRLLLLNLKPANALQVEKYVTDFAEQPNADMYLDALLNKFRLAQRYAQGSSAMNFRLVSLQGDSMSLSDFSGKHVYLSFWARWCDKCIEEMYATEQNKAALSKDKIAFVYVSLEADEANWRNHPVVKDISGTHLWAQSVKAPVANDYGIYSLPRYFLIDGAGRFVSPFKKASDPDFVAYLLELTAKPK